MSEVGLVVLFESIKQLQSKFTRTRLDSPYFDRDVALLSF